MLSNFRRGRVEARQCRIAIQRLGYSSPAHPSQKKETDGQEEANGETEGASFFGKGIKAVAHTVKEKVASAVGMSDKKRVSKNEHMGPAGHMQGRDPDADAEEEYASLKGKTKQSWDEAGVKRGPTEEYPAHGRNT